MREMGVVTDDGLNVAEYMLQIKILRLNYTLFDRNEKSTETRQIISDVINNQTIRFLAHDSCWRLANQTVPHTDSNVCYELIKSYEKAANKCKDVEDSNGDSENIADGIRSFTPQCHSFIVLLILSDNPGEVLVDRWQQCETVFRKFVAMCNMVELREDFDALWNGIVAKDEQWWMQPEVLMPNGVSCQARNIRNGAFCGRNGLVPVDGKRKRFCGQCGRKYQKFTANYHVTDWSTEFGWASCTVELLLRYVHHAAFFGYADTDHTKWILALREYAFENVLPLPPKKVYKQRFLYSKLPLTSLFVNRVEQ
ncbi:hypothetical protein HA402_013056 [Bradysia odoriphaga]|nr:hypothetical protein HA402_013056 [Bradysia odoriphaga]